MKRLAVWHGQAQVGMLELDAGVWSFAYAPTWSAFALSPALALGRHHADTSTPRTVQWFFDNLLPEGPTRDAFARAAQIDQRDLLQLLAHYGEDTAGALTILAPDEAPRDADGYEPVPLDALRVLIAERARMPMLAANRRGRMSLAGVQHKITLHRAAGTFLLPAGGASTIIAKPDNVSADYPFTPANEYFCMRLAHAVGLQVPSAELHHLPEPLYVVTRFDRTLDRKRLHQIDLCQLLNQPPSFKYESDGGASFVDAFTAAKHTMIPAIAYRELLRRQVFNFVIGNSDAHAKNIAFLVQPEGMTLAPAYDLLSVRVYGADFDYLAMAVGEPKPVRSRRVSGLGRDGALPGRQARHCSAHLPRLRKTATGACARVVV